MRELRCRYRKHANLDSAGHLEIKCRDRYCGAGNGYVVLHKFDVKSGELVSTSRYKDPSRRNE